MLMLSYFFFRCLVNVCLARKFNKKYRFRQAFKMEMEIAFFNAITPFSTGGKPYEIYSLNKNKLKIVDASNVAIQNFIVYQIALILLGVIALIINNVYKVLDNNIFTNLVYIGFLINTLVIVVLFIVSFAKKTNRKILKVLVKILSKLKIIKNKEEFKENIEHQLLDFHKGAEILLSKKFEFIKLIIFQVISLTAFYLVPLALMYATGDYTSLTPLYSIVVSAYVMLIGSFVPMPGGVGGLEYVFVTFSNQFIKGSKVFLVMILWRFVTYYFGFIIGAIFVSLNKKEK